MYGRTARQCQPRRKITVLLREGEWQNMGEFNANFMHISLAPRSFPSLDDDGRGQLARSAIHCHIFIR